MNAQYQNKQLNATLVGIQSLQRMIVISTTVNDDRVM